MPHITFIGPDIRIHRIIEIYLKHALAEQRSIPSFALALSPISLLEQCKETPADILISSYSVQDAQFFEFYSQLRDQKILNQRPCLFILQKGQQRWIEKLPAHPYAFYLEKPFCPELLTRMLTIFLNTQLVQTPVPPTRSLSASLAPSAPHPNEESRLGASSSKPRRKSPSKDSDEFPIFFLAQNPEASSSSPPPPSSSPPPPSPSSSLAAATAAVNPEAAFAATNHEATFAAVDHEATFAVASHEVADARIDSVSSLPVPALVSASDNDDEIRVDSVSSLPASDEDDQTIASPLVLDRFLDIDAAKISSQELEDPTLMSFKKGEGK